jgi:hypothetical protein
MAVHEIRETIDTTGVATSNQLIVQKKINLQHGKRHRILHVDWFDDAISGATNPNAADFKMEVFLTNYPLILSDTPFHAGSGVGGPLAGDDQVLFKAHRLSWSGNANARWYNNEFPNQFLGATPTFDFYTPQLYFTVVFTQEQEENFTRTLQQSLYLAVESEDVNAVEYGMGLYQEWSENQMRQLVSNGKVITQAEVIGGYVGWQMGGIRPEIMTGTDAPDNWFFGLEGFGAGEAMQNTTQLRDAVSASREMVAHTAAFGDPLTLAPDWFKLVVRDFASLNTGPLRPDFPPIVKLNSGIGQMV